MWLLPPESAQRRSSCARTMSKAAPLGGITPLPSTTSASGERAMVCRWWMPMFGGGRGTLKAVAVSDSSSVCRLRGDARRIGSFLSASMARKQCLTALSANTANTSSAEAPGGGTRAVSLPSAPPIADDVPPSLFNTANTMAPGTTPQSVSDVARPDSSTGSGEKPFASEKRSYASCGYPVATWTKQRS